MPGTVCLPSASAPVLFLQMRKQQSVDDKALLSWKADGARNQKPEPCSPADHIYATCSLQTHCHCTSVPNQQHEEKNLAGCIQKSVSLQSLLQ